LIFINSYVIFIGLICKFNAEITLGIKSNFFTYKTLINIRAKVYSVKNHLLLTGLTYYSKNIAKYGHVL